MSAERGREHIRGFTAHLLAVGVAIGLTIVFWFPLYDGAGFVGGDIYAYYLPQKDVFAEQVKGGELPLWNPRTGYGYPTIAESQTGVLYPPTWMFYLPLDLNTAYTASHLLHYVLAFAFMWLYARRLGLGAMPALLAALVYVYGWFPPRCSLEWAIIGGTWLPAALWAVESFLRTRRRRFLAVLAVVLAVQLLAGHFSLAFITLLALAAYAPLRIWFVVSDEHRLTGGEGRLLAWLSVPVVAAFVLAAAQLVPTWELKAISQRAEVTQEHDPEYGHMPPMYITQLVASWWYWYADDVDTDQALRGMTFLASSAMTNKVEAHLYFGSLPLLLIAVSVVRGLLFRRSIEGLWAVLGLLFLLYTPGWFVPVTQHLPGFSFFKGPARYGVITTLAAAVLAGFALDTFSMRRRRVAAVAGLVVLGATAAEMFVVSRQIAVAPMVQTPPITLREHSPFTEWLSPRMREVRLFAPGANLPNLCGAAAMPTYLGLSPAEYYTPDVMLPPADVFPTEPQLNWMQRAGITHLLSFDAIASPRLTTILAEADPMLNAAWGRARNRPLYLYALQDARPRAWSESGSVTVVELTSTRVVLDADLTQPGRVVLTDLMFPGWDATVEDESGSSVEATVRAKVDAPRVPEDMFRAVNVPAGRHRITWRYTPRSVYFGAATSAVGWLVLAGICIMGMIRRRRGAPNSG